MKQPCHFEFSFIIAASSGMQLLAGPSHEDHHEDVKEHEERTDRMEILGSEEVEMEITGKLNLKVKNAVETINDVQRHL